MFEQLEKLKDSCCFCFVVVVVFYTKSPDNLSNHEYLSVTVENLDQVSKTHVSNSVFTHSLKAQYVRIDNMSISKQTGSNISLTAAYRSCR